MTSIVSRLIHSNSSPSRLYTSGLLRNGRFLSTDSNRIDEPFKVVEAETAKVLPPPSDKEVKEALEQGLSASSLSRSGRSSIRESWADKVMWHQGNLLVTDSLKDVMNGVTAVISCVGGFGSNSHMYKINGIANINAIRAASEQGVKRIVYVLAADFGVANYLLQGYYEGKKAAEAELLSRFTYGGVILRPGFVHGTRQVGSMKVHLGVIGSPLDMVLKHAKPLGRIPLVGSLFTPPENVLSVAKVAVRAATDPVLPPGIVDVYGIFRYSEQK